ncbi:hypothetical protein ABL841_20535 [Variovorax paradoxus]|uniref:hypothetical protein n=1 Tax=Variovorax paradoxus TaxID=34073 RepID=UPI000360536F|nr:hypothetical protein [Variovorax paradoxus]
MSDSLSTLFTPDTQRLRKLDAAEATRLVRNLLYCGALPMRLRDVVISERITVRDGGIDAKAITETAAPGSTANSFHFQIKSGTTFEPAKEGSIRKELFGRATASGEKSLLGEAVRRCLDAGGVYVLVATGHDLTPLEHDNAERHLRKAFAECGYKAADVEVWGAGQLAFKLRPYPSLCLEVNGVGRGAFETVAQWAARADLQGTLALGDPQKEFIKSLAEILRGDAIQHARVIGEPGSGKTRLTLEAIRSSQDLAARCVYVASPRALLGDASTLAHLVDNERGYWTILVVDDCDEEDRSTIYGMVKGKARLKLITLYHGPELSRDASMRTIDFPQLGEQEIGAILASYLGKKESLHNWIEWCRGSARAAHILGENLQLNPDDILRSPATVNVWDRFVIGYRRTDSAEAQRLLTEMRHVALFRKFGFKGRFKDEADFLAKLIRRADPTVTKRSFAKDVQMFAKRRILQGDSTLQIVPPALQVHLWREWWSSYGSSADLTVFLNELPESLLGWFTDMVRYANGSPEAQQAVRDALSAASSPFAKRKFLRSDRGAAFLSALAEADPASTLKLLERTVDKWLPTAGDPGGHSQSFVSALERIAVWDSLFAPAAALLGKLSAVEKSNYSNNADGTLRSLCKMASGATKTPPMQRLAFIEGLLTSSKPHQRGLGIDLCGELLDTGGSTRVVGVEYQGLLPIIEFWAPKTWGDLYEPWRAALALLLRQQRPSNLEWQQKLSRTIVHACFGLLGHPNLAPPVLEALEGQLTFAGADHEMLVKALLHFFRYPKANATKATKARLRALLVTLSSGPYERRFARFVDYETYVENHTVARSGDLVDSSTPAKRVSALALEMLADPTIADAHLDHAIESQGYRVRDFGERLGESADAMFCELVVEHAKRIGAVGGARFLSGFLEGIRRVDSARSDAMALDLLSGKNPAAWRISAVVWSGATPAQMSKLVKLAKTAPPGLFSGVSFQRAKSSLALSDIEDLVRSLLRNEAANASDVALDIASWWFARDSDPPCSEHLLWKIIADKRLLSNRLQAKQYEWKKLVRRFRELHPSRDIELLDALLAPMNKLPSPVVAPDAFGVLGEICATHPGKTWKIVARALERERGSWIVKEWLGGGSGHDAPSPPILLFEPEQIFAWIDKSPRRRTVQAMGFIPKTLDEPGGALTLAFIERYGGRSGIAQGLAFHFGPTSYSGPSSEHHARQREQALRWSAATSSKRVKAFLDIRVRMLTEDIEREKESEERR